MDSIFRICYVLSRCIVFNNNSIVSINIVLQTKIICQKFSFEFSLAIQFIMHKNLAKARLAKKAKCILNKTRTVVARNRIYNIDASANNGQMQIVRNSIINNKNNKTDVINKRVNTFRHNQIKTLKQRVRTLERSIRNGYKISNCWDIISDNIHTNKGRYNCTKNQMYDL